MSIEKYIVAKEVTILEAMNIINENGKGIVYVCENYELKGAVTDGDIRRFILSNKDLNGSIIEIANKEVKYLYLDSNKDAIDFMKQNKITSVPILNHENKIISIDFLYSGVTYRNDNLNIPLVIMAGGKGTRLYPYTQVLPKPLIPINDKTITEIIIDYFNNFGCNKIYMIVNYKKNLIKAFFNENSNYKNLNFIEEEEFRGTAGGVKLLEPYINTTFFLNNCDVFIKEDYGEILKYHKSSNNLITIVCALKKEIIPYGTIETDGDGKIVNLKEKPEFNFLINTGLYVIEPEIFERLPKNTFIHITDVIQSYINDGLKVGVYPISEENWMDMGQLNELEKMRKRLGEEQY